MADGGRVVAAERVQDADRVGFIGQVGDLGAGNPAEGGDLLSDRKISPGDLAAEDQGDDGPGHVLVDAGQGDGLDVQAGFLADLAAQAVAPRRLSNNVRAVFSGYFQRVRKLQTLTPYKTSIISAAILSAVIGVLI
jgi:hypothetical protein